MSAETVTPHESPPPRIENYVASKGTRGGDMLYRRILKPDQEDCRKSVVPGTIRVMHPVVDTRNLIMNIGDAQTRVTVDFLKWRVLRIAGKTDHPMLLDSYLELIVPKSAGIEDPILAHNGHVRGPKTHLYFEAVLNEPVRELWIPSKAAPDPFDILDAPHRNFPVFPRLANRRPPEALIADAERLIAQETFPQQMGIHRR